MGDRYFDEVQRAPSELSDGGRMPVLLHVNNLENLRDADLAKAATLVRNLRDYLLIPGGHWLFVGKTGITQDVFEAREEVGSIMAQPVVLEALSPQALRGLLDVRYQRLRRGRTFTPPVSLDVAVGLYGRFHGDLRSFLQLLSRAAERALPADGKTSMDEAMILGAVAALYRERMVKRVGDATVAYLEATLRAVAPSMEFRAADLARAANVTRARATQLVDKLLERKVVRRSRTEQTSKYLVPTGEMHAALEAVVRA